MNCQHVAILRTHGHNFEGLQHVAIQRTHTLPLAVTSGKARIPVPSGQAEDRMSEFLVVESDYNEKTESVQTAR